MEAWHKRIEIVWLGLMIATMPAGAVSDFALAAHWAPVIRQDTDDTNYRAEYITRFDYDGNFRGNDNWDHLDDYPLNAYLYYSVVETPTHYFIMYGDFHPRDWEDVCFLWLCHENDMEGLQLCIEKDGSTYGALLTMETEAHGQIYQYASDPRVGGGHESIDGPIRTESHRPVAMVEAKGHGVYGWDGDGFPGGDGVVYRYTGYAEQPSSGSDPDVGYALLSLID